MTTIDQIVRVTPAQLALQHSDAAHILCPAGLGSGKTRGLVLWAVTLAQVNARRDVRLAGLVVEPTYKQVQRILVRELVEVCALLEIKYRYFKQDQLFQLHFGDGFAFDLLLGSTDRPETLVGANLCFVGIDEAGFVSQDAIAKTIPRVRHPLAAKRQWLATGTPEGFGAFYEVAEGSRRLPHSELVRASTWDNVFLPGGPKHYIETNLAHYSEQELEQYCYGRFVARGGRVYEHFDPSRNEAPCEDPFDGDLVMLVDFGVVTSCWGYATIKRTAVRGVVTERLHIWGELVGRRKDTLEMVKAARQQWESAYFAHVGSPPDWRVFAPRIRVYCDATPWQRSDRTIVEQEGFDVVTVAARNETVMDRVYSVNARLRDGLTLVDPEGAPYIRRCLSQQGYDSRGRPEKPYDDGTGQPAVDHGSDAVGYIHVHRWPVLGPRGNSGTHAYH